MLRGAQGKWDVVPRIVGARRQHFVTEMLAGGAEVEKYAGLQGGHEFAAIFKAGAGASPQGRPRSPSGLPLGAGRGELAPTPRGFPAPPTGTLACRDPDRHQWRPAKRPKIPN
jgi:hypothetical protein